MKAFFAFALISFAALRLAAQDVIVNGPSWVDPSDPPDQLPVIKMDKPGYPERLNGSTEIGYVVVDSFIFAEGKSGSEQYLETNALLGDAVEHVDKWRVNPARRAGKPVNSIVRQTFIFNPARASAKESNATPRLLNVVVPELPAGLIKSNDLPDKLYVTASVDASGQVTKTVADAGAPDTLGQRAEEAVLKWSFAPARKNGQPVAQDVRVPVAFLESAKDNEQADTPPRVTYQVEPKYPPEIAYSGQRGRVTVRCVVDIEGRVRNVFVVSSTNPGLNQATIDGVLKWRFEPGRRNGVPVNVRMEVPVDFRLIGGSDDGNEAYDVSNDRSDQSKLPPELRYDIPPKPANTVLAVYPFELLRDGVGGTAEVRFLVGLGGEVAQATVVKATRPEFGQAVLAMLDAWKFQPAMKDGKPTMAVLDIQQEFSDFSGDVPVSDEAKDMLYDLKKGKSALCPLKNLDAPPQLVSQLPPVFPSVLIGKLAAGSAVVEFLIDHDGNVQLPRVVSATDPAFGYAAVQGVAAWKFAPPTSHGKPVAVRAKVPIDFTMPTPVAAADSVPVAPANPASDGGMTNSVQSFKLSDLDQKPIPRFQAPPRYPSEMKRHRITGMVKVGFICDTEGHVQNAHVVKSSGSSQLDQAAVAGVSQWIFKPGMKDGHAVNVRMLVPIAFNLD